MATVVEFTPTVHAVPVVEFSPTGHLRWHDRGTAPQRVELCGLALKCMISFYDRPVVVYRMVRTFAELVASAAPIFQSD